MTKKSRSDFDPRVAKAVRHFWKTRSSQGVAQGELSGELDRGFRRAVTGGKHLDEFAKLLCNLLIAAGIPRTCLFRGKRGQATIPGYFRPTKEWDLIVVAHGRLLGAIELKAHIGPSFGNNFNNRVEEALGSSQDIWTAYREHVFGDSPEPFTGYFMLLEEHAKSTSPVRAVETHFPVVPEFQNVSYAMRWQHTIGRLVHERCYHAAAFLLTDSVRGPRGAYREPAAEFTFDRFAAQMCGRIRTNYDTIAP